MKPESYLCKICPIKEVCSPHLAPSRADERNIVTNDPWQCRHLTCPAGVTEAKKEIKKLKDENKFFDYAYFHTPDKKNERRVSIQTGIIESTEDGIWYSTGQSIHKDYSVKAEDYPYERIRNLKRKTSVM